MSEVQTDSLTGINLITGLIGSGKTLRAVWYMDRELKAGRAVYASNVNGLNLPGVIPFDDPKQWRDLPPGSLLVVDEAQRFWRARRAGEVPQELRDAETSRHDGVTMLIITQQPTYLDKHLRGLITKHEHLYRRLGAKATTVYAWERCIDDPNAASEKDGADQSLFVYPKHLYGAYKSAEVHTVKFGIGTRLKLAIAGLVFAVGMFAWVFSSIGADQGDKEQQEGSAPPVAPATAGAFAPATATPEPRYRSATQYAEAHLPRFATMPWTAQVFDDRAVVSQPELFCMSSMGGDDALGNYREPSCSCLTEQGTTYEVSEAQCRTVARQGQRYNPYKAPQQAFAGGVGGQPPTAMDAAASAPPAASISAPQISGYGDIGVSLKPGPDS